MSRKDRRDPRVEIALSVRLHTASGEESYQTQDVSYRGVFILCDEPLPLRKLVRFRTAIDDSEELQMLGLVAHRVNAADAAEMGRRPGMGIQLFSVGKQTRERWRSFVRECYEEDPEALELITIRELPHLRIHLANEEMKRQFIERDFPGDGIFYRTPDVHPVGSGIVCDVEHPDTGQTIHLKATVTEVAEGSRRNRGMQLVFDELSAASEDRLDRFDRGDEITEAEDLAAEDAGQEAQ